MFIRITKPNGEQMLVNKSHIVVVYIDGTLLMCSGRLIKTEHTFKHLMELLQ